MLLTGAGRLAAFAVLGACLSVACDAGEGPPPPAPEVVAEPEQRPSPPAVGNIVMIVIDTLRADAVGAFEGVDRGTPVLDQLAREGVFFEQATATSSYTRESVLSLFTGELAGSVGKAGWDASPAGDMQTLPLRMRRRGRYTAMVSASFMLDTPGFRRGFDRVRFIGGSQSASQQSPEVSQAALASVSAEPTRPFFLYVHYLDPHGPYDPPAGSVPEFDRFRRVEIYNNARENIEALKEGGFGPGEQRFEDYRTRYAAELSHVDSSIGTLLDGLRSAGQLENALIVVTSDHGEEFLEHGYVEHAWTLYEESIRVPLIVHAPAWLEPGRVEDRVSGVDIVPTLEVLLGGDPPPGIGEPLFEWAPSGWSPRDREGPVFFELGVQTRLLLRGVAKDGWKYLAARRWLTPEERAAAVARKEVGLLPEGHDWIDPWGPIVREELFDLARDPDEREPSDVQGERLQALRSLIQSQRPESSEEPGPATPLSDEQRRQLEALGYL